MWLTWGGEGFDCHEGLWLESSTPGIVQEPLGTVKPAKGELGEYSLSIQLLMKL